MQTAAARTTAARLDLKLPAGSSSPLDTLTTELLSAGSDKPGAYYRPEAHTRNKDGTYDKILLIRKRGPADYEKKMQSLGADNNAFTTEDFTFYVPLVPKESLAELVSVEAERVSTA